MTVLKENLIPTLIILVAGLIVSFAALPLQNTEWAESFRAGVGESGDGVAAEGAEGVEVIADGQEDGQEGDAPGGIIMVIGPLIKVTLLMGIGGLLTVLVLWIIRMVRRTGSGSSEAIEGSG